MKISSVIPKALSRKLARSKKKTLRYRSAQKMAIRRIFAYLIKRISIITAYKLSANTPLVRTKAPNTIIATTSQFSSMGFPSFISS